MSSQNTQTEEYAIHRVTEDWSAAVKAQDVGRLAAMVTEDVVFLPPGFPPIKGREAVEAMYRSFFPQFSSVRQTVSIEEIGVSGEWAFLWGTEATVLTPKAGGPPIEMRGMGMSILRRQPDGTLKFARAINNAAIKSASIAA
jgi:uncharacterized protein (TIGR02246 family)